MARIACLGPEGTFSEAALIQMTAAGLIPTAPGTATPAVETLTTDSTPAALNAVRDGSRHVDVDDTTTQALEADMSVQAHHEVEEAFELNASLGRLQHCLEALDPARRNCVLHAYVDGCSHGEIAERLGAPLGTVKAWIRRSLVSLRECMA